MWKLHGDRRADPQFKADLSSFLEKKYNLYGILVYKNKDSEFRDAVHKDETWIDWHNSSGEDFLVFCYRDESVTEVVPIMGYMTAIGAGSSIGSKKTYDKFISYILDEEITWSKTPLLILLRPEEQAYLLHLPKLASDEYRVYLKELFSQLADAIENNPSINIKELMDIACSNNNQNKFKAILLKTLPKAKKVLDFFKDLFK